nr:bifunctional hydroxymethylpyrimidine kinase/phosphomethylpyrimidine kinase [uncultured Roseateles sp.]
MNSAWPQPCLPSAYAPDQQDLTPSHSAPPIIWSIAGTDSGGGAGLAADLRAAAAMGVHLCPVVAAVTAQNSLGVQAVHALPAAQIEAQLAALAADMRPRVIKCGLLASVAAVEAVARCIDTLRSEASRGSVALVVDPVLGATAGGAAFADESLLEAYRQLLLPRATLITPNRREAQRLAAGSDQLTVPELAEALRALGAEAVCITGGDDLALGAATPADEASSVASLALDWLAASLGSTPVNGWLALPRLPSIHHHGSGCTFASAAAAALAHGFPLPDAVLLAKMLTWAAVRDGHAAGQGAGPVRANASFIADPSCMPVMSFADERELSPATLARWRSVLAEGPNPSAPELGLYAITDSPAKAADLLALGLPQVQLRIKAGAASAHLQADIAAAVQAAASAGQGQLWINDHWQLALAAGAQALHLGQEDWAGLNAEQRELIVSSKAKLGISSHSLWELARARGLKPSYIACGPVFATTTKDMPWRPQAMVNLRWWVRMAGRPVVAIGGLLTPAQVEDCAAQGAAAACLVRAAEAALAAVGCGCRGGRFTAFRAGLAGGPAARRKPGSGLDVAGASQQPDGLAYSCPPKPTSTRPSRGREMG